MQQIDILGRGSILGMNNVINGNVWYYRARVCSEQSLNVIQISRQQIKKLSQQQEDVTKRLLDVVADH